MKIDQEWDAALPYESIPGPSKYTLIRGFAPGGSLNENLTKKKNICLIKTFVIVE